MNYTDWIVSEIKKITTEFVDRVAGSENVKRSEAYMKSKLEGWADNITTEQFRLSPYAFIASIPLEATCAIAGVACYLLSGISRIFLWIAIILFAITLVAMIFEYILYYQTFDFLYPKADGQNLYAERKAKSETKKRVVICGHADAAFEMPLFNWQNPPLFYGIIAIAYLCLFVTIVLCIMALCKPGYVPPLALRIIMMVVSMSFVPFLFFARWHVISPGANDNMTGCLIGMSILKEMAENDERFEHTDVCCLITDGEESGLRGANYFAKKHKDELKDVETIVLVADTVNEVEELMIYPRGINWTQKNSPYVCGLLKQAGGNLGMDIPYAGFYPGANDSEAFSRNGFHSAAICGVSHVPGDYYHNRNDNWQSLNPECIRLTRDIVKEAVRLFDEDDAK